MKHIEVVAAVIIVDNKILCVQRNVNKHDYISYKFEFPGGKPERGETPEQALKREIREELKMDISIERPFLTVHHSYPDFKITMQAFICSSPDRELTLTEHIAAKWMDVDLLATLDWAEADIAVVDKIIYEGIG
jgi:8-oxo-dGTP diphosphatase